MELSTVITDPFDWPVTMPELRTIDNLLRCGICCEFLNIAMILPKCSHNYCSQCIRRYMNYKSQCPACNTPAIEGEIRNNKVVDEIVKNFVLVRPAILKLCKGQGSQSSASCSGTVTPTRRRKDDKKLAKSAERVSSLTPGTARAVEEASKYFTSETPTRPSAAPTKPSAGPVNCTTPLNRSNEENISPGRLATRTDENEDDDDDDVIVLDDFQPDQKHAASATPSTSKGSDGKNLATRSDKSDCPVCGVSVAVKYINGHLDACLRRSTEQPRNSAKQKTERRKPLPKLVYNIMSDKELRKKLKEYKLATQGTRKDLARRLQEYTVLYNAQCDSDDPVPVDDVIKYHERMEKIRSKPAQKSSAKAFKLKVEKGQDGDTILKSQQEYLKHHNHQFENLIKSARERMKKSKLPTMDGVADRSTAGTSTAQDAGTSGENSSSTSCSAATAGMSKDSTTDIEQGSVTAESLSKDAMPGGIEARHVPGPSSSEQEPVIDEPHLDHNGSDAHEDQTHSSSSHAKLTPSDSVGRQQVGTGTAAGTVGMVPKYSNSSPLEGGIDEDPGQDECVSITTVTTDEGDSVEEPRSPTLFDNISFDEGSPEGYEGAICDEGQTTAGSNLEDEQMGRQKSNISDDRWSNEDRGDRLARGHSDHTSTGPLDLQTSPVFNGVIHRSNTPTIGSESPNSRSASPVPHQTQAIQDSHEVSSRGRLRRKRKTALEQLDVDVTNTAGEETTRRASKRNKKSMN